MNEDTVTRSRQAWTRQVTTTHLGHPIRATVHRDSYDFQCRLSAAIFSPTELKWNAVQTLSPVGLVEGLTSPYAAFDLERQARETSQPLVDGLLAYAAALVDAAAAVTA